MGGHVFARPPFPLVIGVGGPAQRGGRNSVIEHWAGESSLRGPQVRNTRKNASATLSLMLLACCKFGEEGKVLKEATATRLS